MLHIELVQPHRFRLVVLTVLLGACELSQPREPNERASGVWADIQCAYDGALVDAEGAFRGSCLGLPVGADPVNGVVQVFPECWLEYHQIASGGERVEGFIGRCGAGAPSSSFPEYRCYVGGMGTTTGKCFVGGDGWFVVAQPECELDGELDDSPMECVDTTSKADSFWDAFSCDSQHCVARSGDVFVHRASATCFDTDPYESLGEWPLVCQACAAPGTEWCFCADDNDCADGYSCMFGVCGR